MMSPSEGNERISNDKSTTLHQINNIEQEDIDDGNDTKSINLLVESNKDDTIEIMEVAGTPTDDKYCHMQEDASLKDGIVRVLEDPNNSKVTCGESQGEIVFEIDGPGTPDPDLPGVPSSSRGDCPRTDVCGASL